MMKALLYDIRVSPPMRSLLWFLFCWLGLTYLWIAQFLFGRYKQCDSSTSASPVLPKGSSIQGAGCAHISFTGAFPPLILCTALILLYGLLLWINMSEKLPQRFRWCSFLLQGGLIFTIGMIVPQGNILLSLYLTVTLEALSSLQYARFTIIVATGALALFLLSSILGITTEKQQDYWQAFFLTPSFDYVAPILFVVGYLVLYMHQLHMYTQLKATHTELALTHNKLEDVHAQLLTSAARIEELTLLTERERIARELHDTLAQGVAGLIMQLEAANTQLNRQQFTLASNIVQMTMANARATLSDARRAIDDIRTISSHSELSEMIQQELQRFYQTTGIVCQAELASLSLVPAFLSESVFRMLREGLTNISKHAQASQVWIRIRHHATGLTIELRDNGRGFDLSHLNKQPGHYGLIGLQERACLAGGTLQVESMPGHGTLIQFSIPINNGVHSR
jgi:NarL family two-component system sensor histidine kinase YdfH